MRLISGQVGGYKRFSGESEMDLDADVICIVGPNAAGKSSFLDALRHLNGEDAFDRAERTRTEGGGTQAPTLRANYALDDDDRRVLASVPEAQDATGFRVSKYEDGTVGVRVSPEPRRDLTRRRGVAGVVGDLLKSPWLENEAARESGLDEPPESTLRDLVDQILALLESDKETLAQDEIEWLIRLRDRVEAVVPKEGGTETGEVIPKRYRSLPGSLQKLIEHESASHPHERAASLLKPSVPRFLKFGDEQRALEPVYDLTGESDAAIDNLLALAGAGWEEVAEVVRSGDKGRKNVLLDRTKKKLEQRITIAWGQSPLTVSFDLDGPILTILMSMQAEDYIQIDQHSDGLRQFVALRAFIALADQDVKPIVLIDEAEMHLHYDAQADLVTIFEEQHEAAKIIYTTHSAGCLPRDLGAGVRGVVPIEIEKEGKRVQTDHSKIVNGIWETNHGFSPLLIAMGASAFAFSASQKAIIGEGFTDALLLPSLIREALGADRLAYQVVPHFARVRRDQVPDLDLIAARVAFLADGDEGGEGHIKKLIEDGEVLEEQVVYLGGSSSSGLSLEDLVDKPVYLEAVNVELGRRVAGLEFPASELPDTGRSKKLRAWCDGKTDSAGQPLKVTKVAVAQRILEMKKNRPLVAPDRVDVLKDLNLKVSEIFGKPAHKLPGA